MKKLNLNNYKSIYYILWDNTDNTINDINEYFKNNKRNYICNRNWDDNTKSNSGDILCISEKMYDTSMTDFFRIGEYVIDLGDHFMSMSKEDFELGEKLENLN
jgi:hypothetical protein